MPAASLRSALASAVALVLPLHCAGCGAPDFALCAACRAELEGAIRSRMLGGELRVWSAASYEGPVARVLTAFKDGGLTASAPLLAEALRRALAAAVDTLPEDQGPVLLVPVPSSPGATRRRGYLPLQVIARAGGLPLASGLRHVRSVRDQAALSASERAVNLEGSLAAARSLAGRDVILVDDVVTTGSTLREAARAVRAGGGRVVGAATIATTPQLTPARDVPSSPP